jgi:hypothetical protein
MLTLHRDLDVVIGVDTHEDTHTAAAVGVAGAVLEHVRVPADPAGSASGGVTPRRCGPSKTPAARCRTDHGAASVPRADR